MHYYFTLFLCLLFSAVFAQQQATTLVVRAKAKDAKFIGTSIGGAYVVVKDPVSGKVLAEGFTEGSTGNTQRIMQEPQQRNRTLSDQETARFETTLQLEKPQFVTVEVWAPYNQPGARVQAQTQLWLLPGKSITGDGLVVEIPGFIVSALAPQAHESVPAGKALPLRANVVLTCGCPVTPGGIWDANRYEVEALVYKEGKLLQRAPLQVKDKDSTFEGSFVPQAAGLYEIIITAYDPASGNTGADKVNIIVK
ncbi:hypothetical protein D770_16285 [Flammeovirgaceae bacterium 311]|nr:hypothetical protein D770_16285 [Flammeovirgaceae bacterium 311]